MTSTALLLFASVLAAGDPKPNIVFILADDLGINDLSCYGRQDQPTPNLDRLASQGVRFTSAYAAQNVCSPTRSAVMTGKSPARLHITTFLPGRGDTVSQPLLHPVIRQQLPLEEVTIAERLKAAGYATACLGKWHLGGKGFAPEDQGFDVVFTPPANTKPSADEGGKGEYALTARAEKFIEDNKDRPFFLYLPHNNPHIPIAAKPELIEKHKNAWNPTYAAVIETLDDTVGRVVAKIDALGLGERTLIVFQSDNGGLHVNEGALTPSTHNAPWRAGKGYNYEGGLRIPQIARWTGRIKAGSTTDVPTISTDWVPTLLDVAGVRTDNLMDGVSLFGLLTGGAAPAARPLFWHFPHYTNQGGRPGGAIREGSWKLLEHYEDGRLELFDLSKDPGEADDVSAKEPARVAALRGKLEKWRRDVGAQSNTANPKFNPALHKRLYMDFDTTKLPAEPSAVASAAKQAPWRSLMNSVVRKAGPKAPLDPDVKPGAGCVILHARSAKVHGTKLKYEDPPHKDTLGFWVNPADWAEWEFEVPAAGTFEVIALVGCGKGSGGSEVELAVDGQAITFKVEETGHFQRFVPRVVGSFKFDKPGKATLTLKAKSKPGAAVMDLRQIVMRGQ